MKLSQIIKDMPYKTKYIAERIGVSEAAVYKYKEGSKRPKLETLVKIAELAEMSIEKIVRATLKGNQ